MHTFTGYHPEGPKMNITNYFLVDSGKVDVFMDWIESTGYEESLKDGSLDQKRKIAESFRLIEK